MCGAITASDELCIRFASQCETHNRSDNRLALALARIQWIGSQIDSNKQWINGHSSQHSSQHCPHHCTHHCTHHWWQTLHSLQHCIGTEDAPPVGPIAADGQPHPLEATLLCVAIRSLDHRVCSGKASRLHLMLFL